MSIIENLNRKPAIEDFKEEWVIFLTESDMQKYPEILPAVHKRIGDIKRNFFKQNKPFFNGWDEFIQAVYHEYTNKLKRK